MAAKFADAPQITDDDDGVSSLRWTNAQIEAGVSASDLRTWVFLGDAFEETQTLDETVALLRAVFEDSIVAVSLLNRGGLVHAALARPGDISASFNRLDGVGSGDMPDFDEVRIESWSGAYDGGGPA